MNFKQTSYLVTIELLTT